MMPRCRNYIICLCLLLCTFCIYAQNPASPPRDTTASLPEQSFESFWQTFEDRYAFFKLRGIDWQAAYNKYRPMVNKNTTDDSLFAILSRMVAPFHDDHINIIIPNTRQFTAEKPSHFLKEFSSPELQQQFWKMVDATLLRNKFDSLKLAGPEYRAT